MEIMYMKWCGKSSYYEWDRWLDYGKAKSSVLILMMMMDASGHWDDKIVGIL
jgi:hypothetical protein